MAKAYTPGLKVSTRTRHRVRRQLPLAGDVLVKVGDHVQARQTVAQTFLPGDVTPLNLAKLLGAPPGDVPGCLVKKEGDRIAPDDVLARTKGIFGKFRTEYKSTVAGTIESVSSVTGQVIVRGEPLPVEIKAYLTGRVAEILPSEGCVIEADVTFVQGIFGIGGETFGPVRMACKSFDQELADDLITDDMQGCVVVGGARMTERAIEKAREVGVAAVVSGGIDDQDLKTFLGYDLGVAITGSERLGLTLIITEGFGEIAMAERTFRLFASREGDDAAVNGATQIRAGVMRPEIVVPLKEQYFGVETAAAHPEGYLEVGMPVRIIRDPYFGLIGAVSALPSEPRVLESGSKARVLEITFDTGEAVIIPRANVELIEE
jgi:biotin carboxyl carrier protein